MTAAAIGGWVEFPPAIGVFATTDATTTLDATTDYAAFVCRVPATGTIDKIHARVGTTNLIGTLSCQIQTLDSGGDPSGSAYGSSAQSDIVVTGTEDNSMLTFSSIACSATIGDYMCIRIWPTVVTSGSVAVSTTASQTGTAVEGLPYSTVRTTGTGAGTHGTVSQGPTVEYSSAVYHQVGWCPATTYSQESVDANGSVVRIGNRFILPVPLTVVGAYVQVDNDTDTTSVKLYDTNGTSELASVNLVSANRHGTAARMQRVFFSSAVNLRANTASAYRVVITTGNTSATAAGITVADTITAAHMAMLPLGTAMYHTQHDGSSWTDNTGKRAAIGLLVSKFDDGFGFGRASYHMGI